MHNPMVSLTKIDPSEIPAVSHKFLMRGERRSREPERNGDRGFGWSKKTIPQSKSGRTIKGRGNFRYRTPSRSRSRSNTPEHWKAAQRNVIKLTDFERIEEQKKSRDAELERRAEERKKRHEALARGDGKKPFFELAQDVVEPPVLTIASSLTRPEKSGSVDLNALDYEESDSDREPRKDKNGDSGAVGKPRRSRSPIRQRSRSNRRDFRPANRNRFDNNQRWNNRRFEPNNRLRRTKSRSRSRSR